MNGILLKKNIYLSKKKVWIEKIRNPITICSSKKIAVHVTSYHAQKTHSFSVKPEFVCSGSIAYNTDGHFGAT